MSQQIEKLGDYRRNREQEYKRFKKGKKNNSPLCEGQLRRDIEGAKNIEKILARNRCRVYIVSYIEEAPRASGLFLQDTKVVKIAQSAIDHGIEKTVAAHEGVHYDVNCAGCTVYDSRAKIHEALAQRRAEEKCGAGKIAYQGEIQDLRSTIIPRIQEEFGKQFNESKIIDMYGKNAKKVDDMIATVETNEKYVA